jgi:hypothetical protein
MLICSVAVVAYESAIGPMACGWLQTLHASKMLFHLSVAPSYRFCFHQCDPSESRRASKALREWYLSNVGTVPEENVQKTIIDNEQ